LLQPQSCLVKSLHLLVGHNPLQSRRRSFNLSASSNYLLSIIYYMTFRADQTKSLLYIKEESTLESKHLSNARELNTF